MAAGRKKLETSKVLLAVGGCLFGVHLLIPAALIYFGLGAQAVSLMQACVPVYITAIGGYIGKAGCENVTKIKSWTEGVTNANISDG